MIINGDEIWENSSTSPIFTVKVPACFTGVPKLQKMSPEHICQLESLQPHSTSCVWKSKLKTDLHRQKTFTSRLHSVYIKQLGPPPAEQGAELLKVPHQHRAAAGARRARGQEQGNGPCSKTRIPYPLRGLPSKTETCAFNWKKWKKWLGAGTLPRSHGSGINSRDGSCPDSAARCRGPRTASTGDGSATPAGGRSPCARCRPGPGPPARPAASLFARACAGPDVVLNGSARATAFAECHCLPLTSVFQGLLPKLRKLMISQKQPVKRNLPEWVCGNETSF